MEIPPGASTHVPSASLAFHWLLRTLLSDVICCVELKEANQLPVTPPLSVCVRIAAVHWHFVEVVLCWARPQALGRAEPSHGDGLWGLKPSENWT